MKTKGSDYNGKISGVSNVWKTNNSKRIQLVLVFIIGGINWWDVHGPLLDLLSCKIEKVPMVWGEVLMKLVAQQWKKEKAVYIVCHDGKPFMSFSDINTAFTWLKLERGAEQIQGWQFTKGFTIIDAPMMQAI